MNKDKLQSMLITQEIHYDKLNLGRLFNKYYSLNNHEVPVYTCEEPKRVIINDLVRDSWEIIKNDCKDISQLLMRTLRTKVAHCGTPEEKHNMNQQLSVLKLPDVFKETIDQLNQDSVVIGKKVIRQTKKYSTFKFPNYFNYVIEKMLVSVFTGYLYTSHLKKHPDIEVIQVGLQCLACKESSRVMGSDTSHPTTNNLDNLQRVSDDHTSFYSTSSLEQVGWNPFNSGNDTQLVHTYDKPHVLRGCAEIHTRNPIRTAGVPYKYTDTLTRNGSHIPILPYSSKLRYSTGTDITIQ